MAVFDFSKMAAIHHHLGFLKVRIFNCRFGGPMCASKPNFVLIGQTVAEIWQFFNFSRWRPSAILDLF